jgi:DNA-binding PucR family transcriptional regulator
VPIRVTHLDLLAELPPHVRDTFRELVLGPIITRDHDHGSDWLHTLEVLLRNGGALRATATELHLHVNTLRYRLHQIQLMTGRNALALDSQVDFVIALELRHRQLTNRALAVAVSS